MDSKNNEPTKTVSPENDQTKSVIQATELPGVYVAGSHRVFWGEDPNVLFRTMEIFPTKGMTFAEQINALTRFIVLFTLLLFIVFQRISFLFVGAITVFIIWVFYVTRSYHKSSRFGQLEAFQTEMNTGSVGAFDTPSVANPFSNVLMTDYLNNPEKLPAPPIDDPAVSEGILQKAKMLVQNAHPNFPDISERLFTNLGDQYQFEQSMQPFYSQSATTIPNDRKAFTDFCYGDITSCKEGNIFACARWSSQIPGSNVALG